MPPTVLQTEQLSVKADVETKLKLNVFKRVKKLKKLRRRMRIWGVAEVFCIACCAYPITIKIFVNQIPFFPPGSITMFTDDWAVLLSMAGVGMLGAYVFSQQHHRDKEKYNRIRAGTIALIEAGAPICECKWLPCDCKDDLIRKMSDKYDINLSY